VSSMKVAILMLFVVGKSAVYIKYSRIPITVPCDEFENVLENSSNLLKIYPGYSSEEMRKATKSFSPASSWASPHSNQVSPK
jgi:hypothetical protein